MIKNHIDTIKKLKKTINAQKKKSDLKIYT